jgi:hypothetical protein
VASGHGGRRKAPTLVCTAPQWALSGAAARDGLRTSSDLDMRVDFGGPATQHEPGRLGHVLDLRTEAEGSACSAGRLAAAKSAMATRLAAAPRQRS